MPKHERHCLLKRSIRSDDDKTQPWIKESTDAISRLDAGSTHELSRLWLLQLRRLGRWVVWPWLGLCFVLNLRLRR